MRVPWLSLALFTLSALVFSVYRLEAGTSTFSATPGAGATLRETTDASGFFLPNTTIWDYAAGANGLQINADHTMATEGIVSNASSALATNSANNGTIAFNYGFNGTTWDQLQVDASKFLKVNVSAGTVSAAQSGNWTARIVGNAGGIMDFAGQNAATPASALMVGGMFVTSPTTLTTGDSSPFQMDSTGKLLVNCGTGCSAGSFNNNADAVATSSTNGQAAAWLYGYNGATWDRLRVDGSKNLDVNCAVGCATGGVHISVPTTPTVQAAAYSSGNAIGGLQTISLWRSTSFSSGKIDNISIASKGGSTQTMTVYLFNLTPGGSTCTDKTAFSLAAADVSKMVAAAPIVMTPQVVGVGSTVSFASVAPTITVSNAAVSTNIFMCVVVDGAVTPASTTDLVITVAASQD